MAKKKKKRAHPKDVRTARAFLRGRGFTTQMIPPRTFVEASQALGKDFNDTLTELARMKMGGQGQGQSEEATQIAERQPIE